MSSELKSSNIRVGRSLLLSTSASDSSESQTDDLVQKIPKPSETAANLRPSVELKGSEFYVPLFYSEKIKNPGKFHILKRVVLGHWVFGVIAWSCISPHPLTNAFSLLLLTLSYWCVYEIGYQENDDIASKYERRPTLSSTYCQYRSHINLGTPWPWVWAAMLAIPGCLLFSLSQQTVESSLLNEGLSSISLSMSRLTAVSGDGVSIEMLRILPAWFAFLAVVRVTFGFYNRVNEATRVWIYPLLQIQQLFGFSLLGSTNAIGSLLLLSLTFSRWIQYCVYRCGGDRKGFPINLGCLVLFTLLFTTLCLSSPDRTSWFTAQAVVAFSYCSLRSAKKIIELKSTVGWLRQHPVNNHSFYKGV